VPVSQPVRIRICFMLFNELLLVENTPSSYMYLGRVRGRGGGREPFVGEFHRFKHVHGSTASL
jgi:hypothetical protein